MAIIQSRNIFVANTVRRGRNQKFTQGIKGVGLTGLKAVPRYASFISETENMAIMYISGVELAKKDSINIVQNYTRVNMLSNVGLSVVKGVIKSTTKQQVENLFKLNLKMLFSSDPDKLYWFAGDKNEIVRILVERGIHYRVPALGVVRILVENLQLLKKLAIPNLEYTTLQIDSRIKDLQEKAPDAAGKARKPSEKIVLESQKTLGREDSKTNLANTNDNYDVPPEGIQDLNGKGIEKQPSLSSDKKV